METPLLTMNGVTKRFGATLALDDVSLSVRHGRVHALIGENGAGKSTLMKVLAGVHPPDCGHMTLGGTPYAPSGPAAALSAGVAMIHQELNLAPHLSVAANIVLGQEPRKLGLLRRSQQDATARRALARLSQPDLPLKVPVGSLPIAMQQLVEIARAIASDARVVVFDEPTSVLGDDDTEHLFAVIRDLRAAGIGVVYISHFLEEVQQLADDYTVLRDGRVVGTGLIADSSLDAIVRAMVGREIDEFFPHVAHQIGEPLLNIRGLTGIDTPSDVDLDVHRGEIVGIAGLVGAGRTELVRCVYGLDRVRRGEVTVARIGNVGQSPRRSIRRGVGFVSEDRKDEGLAVDLSIADNLTMSRLSPYRRYGWLNLASRDRGVVRWLDRVGCKYQHPGQPVAELSGGNQQKVAIGRLLHQDADVLLLDEPTRGIDISAKAEIYRLVGQLAAAGKAIVIVSSYLPELLNVCDRIGVMCRGRLREVRPSVDWSEEEIMHSATGQEQPR
ncbi:MAG: sugar ABC transporter ATP-binding protein [Planctomycetales bacterium]|nr:sugar ABC transporter ATP-binding protein [Planctomycetales bacterium]